MPSFAIYSKQTTVAASRETSNSLPSVRPRVFPSETATYLSMFTTANRKEKVKMTFISIKMPNIIAGILAFMRGLAGIRSLNPQQNMALTKTLPWELCC